MKSIKRKGFTLVELLIVIVVIGILAAMMMLSSTEAVTSSKVNNITSNLRNLKTAALSLYTDSYDNFASEPNKEINLVNDVVPYLSQGSTIPDIGAYSIRNIDDATYGGWYLYYDTEHNSNPKSEQPKIKAKLKARAKSLGLLEASNLTNTGTDSPHTEYGADGLKKYVVMKVR